eukprot:1803092-Amphidinium_carterae.1
MPTLFKNLDSHTELRTGCKEDMEFMKQQTNAAVLHKTTCALETIALDCFRRLILALLFLHERLKFRMCFEVRRWVSWMAFY